MMMRTRSRRRGLTLIELLLALAGTAFVGAAVASMLVAVSYGTRADKDMRTLVVKHKTIDARLSGAIRASCTVLEQSDDLLILWMYDADGNAQPNLAEVCRIERASDVMTAYRAPDDLDEADNVAWPLDADFDALTAALKGGASFPGEIWATRMTEWTIALDAADASEARLVSYRFTLAAGDMRDTAVNAVALRNVR